MKQKPQTVKEITEYLKTCNEQELALFDEMFGSDERKTIQNALKRAHRRIDAYHAECARVRTLYQFDTSHADNGGLVLGIDEVGRGPLAGPLCVAGVVLNPENHILYINDSKQVRPEKRVELSRQIREQAYAFDIVMIEPSQIDEIGMSRALHQAFSQVIEHIDESCADKISRVLIDGVPQHLDSREVAIVKGDAHSASIACASIIAKAARDELMEEYAQRYPVYHFESNKGYGSAEHISAIQTYGLCPFHRVSFCQNFIQDRLF